MATVRTVLTTETLRLIRELRGTVCRCGNSKHTRTSLCPACYFAVPPKIRRKLWLRIGEGYEAAYAEASAALDRRPN